MWAREQVRRRIQRILNEDEEVVLNWETAGRLIEIYHKKFAKNQEAIEIEINNGVMLTIYSDNTNGYGFLPNVYHWPNFDLYSALSAYSLALEKLNYSIKR